MSVHEETTYFASNDGVSRIKLRRWLPAGEPKAVLQIAHGIAEHIERYDALARRLAENGFVVVGNDHLGHGGSAEASGLGFFAERDGWMTVVRDMRSIFEAEHARYPGIPYVLLGHSMGSFLARTYMTLYDGLDAVVLSGTGFIAAPVAGLGLAVAGLERRRIGARGVSSALYGMMMGAYSRAVKNARTNCDWISRDEKIVDAYVADPNCGWMPSVGMLADMLGGLRYIAAGENLARMDKALPLYIMSGDMDPVGSCGKGVIKLAALYEKLGMRDVTVKLYPGARHELFNEINREEATEDMLNWLCGKLGLEVTR